MADSDDEEISPEAFLRQLERAGMFEGREEVLEQLRLLAAAGVHPLQVLRQSQRPPQEEPGERLLDSFNLEGIARFFTERRCRRVVVMCGAGISTSAGIPDFRTPGTGLYDNLQRFNLPRAEAVFELGYFQQHPEPFYELARDLWPGNYNPTPAHYFMRLLHDTGVLLRCYSQNIDSLERLAGLPADKLVAAHGNFDAAHVVGKDPEVEVDIAELKAAIDQGEEGWKALRDAKGGLVKPKIVFFGEELPPRFMGLHQGDLASCDLLIVMGTSLVVHPFAGLVGMAKRGAPRLLINRDAAGTCDRLQFGFRFELQGEGENWRDAWHQGDCDAGCRALADALGWLPELDSLVESKGAATVLPAPWVLEAQGAASPSGSPH